MAQPKYYIQLSQEERDRIAALYAQQVSRSEIARQLQRNKSTISREITRNKAPIRNVYGACRAHNKAKDRKQQAGQRPRLKNTTIRRYVIRHLRMACGHSPRTPNRYRRATSSEVSTASYLC